MNRLLTLLGIVLLIGTSCTPKVAEAQQKKKIERPQLELLKIDSSYSFICYDTNHLYIAPDSSLIRGFFDKLNRVTSFNQGNINIVHIGSSHVQGGTLPHRIRRNILSYYPDLIASRGMIFPYSAAAKCNNPYDYKVRRSHALALTRNVYKEPQHPMGLCGIAVNAYDSTARIGITLAEPLFDFATTQLILLGESPEGGVPYLECEGKEVVPADIDSVKHRYLFNLPCATDSFTVVLPSDSAQHFSLRGLFLKNRKPGISYHSIGVNGAAVSDYFKCQYFTEDLRLVKPDLVIFGIGINDAAGANFDTAVFRQNYLQLIDSFRVVNPQCAFIFITNNDSFKKTGKRSYTVNANGVKARDVFYRLADDVHGAVWDQFSVMGGLKSMDKWRIAGLAQTDRVHFTRKGYELVGDLFSNAFLEAWIAHQQPVKKKQLPRKTSVVDERYPYISY